MYEAETEENEPQRQLDEVASIIAMANAKVKEYTEAGQVAEGRARTAFACAEIWQRMVTSYGKSEPNTAETRRR